MLKAIRRYMTRERVLRLAAFLIDALVFCAILAIINAVFKKPDYGRVQEELSRFSAVQGDAGAAADQAKAVISAFQDAFLFTLISFFCYEGLFCVLLSGRTPGKAISGLRVVPAAGAHIWPLTILKYLARSALKCIFILLFRGIPFFLSCVTILSDGTNRAAHDRVCRTMVIADGVPLWSRTAPVGEKKT